MRSVNANFRDSLVALLDLATAQSSAGVLKRLLMRCSLYPKGQPMTCREMMTPDPAFCVPTDNVVTAAMLMKSQDVGSIPIVSDRVDRRLTGIVTDRDIALRVVAEQREYYQCPIKDVMSGEPVACRADDDYQDALNAMAKYQIRRIPVVDDQHRLIGIIAQADVVRDAPRSKETVQAISEISRPGSQTEINGKKTSA